MSVDAMVPLLQSALGVSTAYSDTKIPDLIRRTITRLLRDYHFPKAVKKQSYLTAALGDFSFALPAGFKKELELRYYDPTAKAYSDPLERKQNFQLPYATGTPRYYWLEGTTLLMDTPYPASMVGFNTYLWYESMDSASNEDWLTTDFPDAVYYLAATRGAAEFRKSEVAATYGPLWADERESLAVYLNELEWNNSALYMRPARGYPQDRYPA